MRPKLGAVFSIFHTDYFSLMQKIHIQLIDLNVSAQTNYLWDMKATSI